MFPFSLFVKSFFQADCNNLILALQNLNSILQDFDQMGFERSQHIAISVAYIIIYFADNPQKPLFLSFKAEFAYFYNSTPETHG